MSHTCPTFLSKKGNSVTSDTTASISHTPNKINYNMPSNIITPPTSPSLNNTYVNNTQRFFNHFSPQFSKTLPQPATSITTTLIPVTMSMHQAIASFLADIDIDHVHPDLARTLCKRIGSLFLIPFPDWLKYGTMPLFDMKEHLHVYA